MVYDIVEWAYAVLGDDFEFTSREAVKDELEKKRGSDGKFVGDWLDKYGWDNVYKKDGRGGQYQNARPVTGRSLQTSIDDYQREEVVEVVGDIDRFNELERMINAATTGNDLLPITKSEIREVAVSPEEAERLADLLDEKATDLKSEEEEIEDDIRDEIRSATTLDELNAVDVTRAITGPSEERLRRELASRRAQLT